MVHEFQSPNEIISATSSGNSVNVGTAHNGLTEPEDYDELIRSTQKNDPKKRIRTTPEQLRILEKTYERETNPSQSLREDIARRLGMTPRRVQVWFQNKRAKERRITKSIISEQQSQYHGGSSGQDSPLSASPTNPSIPLKDSRPVFLPIMESGIIPKNSPPKERLSLSPPQKRIFEQPPGFLSTPQVQLFSVPVPEGRNGRIESSPRLPFPENFRSQSPDMKLPPIRVLL